MRYLALCLALLLPAAAPAYAQAQAPATAAPAPAAASSDAAADAPSGGLRDFCADRPGRATPPCILDAGHIQVETALDDAVFQHNDGAHATLSTYGATEVRFGITSTLEAEVAWAPLIVDHERGASDRTGVGDLSVGFRTALLPPGGDGPQVALQAFVTAPTATHGLGAGGWAGGARLPISAPLGKSLSFGMTPEVDVVRNANGGGTHEALIDAVSLSHAFGKLTLGVEAWGAFDDDPSHQTYQATADLTAALMIGDNLQLDAGGNFGLNRATPNAEIYVGISRRF
jgi:hypothetical protein